MSDETTNDNATLTDAAAPIIHKVAPPCVDATLTHGERFPQILATEPDNDPLPVITRLPRVVIDGVGYTVEGEDLSDYAEFFLAA